MVSDLEKHSQQFKANGTKLAASPKKSHLNLDKKPLPLPEGHYHSDRDIFTHEFTRNDVRGLIHSITQELKIKGVKTPLVLLAFRPKADDHKLSEFLATVVPNGTTPAKQSIVDKLVKTTDEFTLVSALKYIWSRLPMNCVIGWDAYDSFKKLEERDNYPEKAFLEFMPQCLSSPSHASIVYDFLDLIVSFAANSKENQLSGRKIAKMAGIWAFHGPQDTMTLTKSRLDPTENTFVDGLRDWLPAADAMFHLLLSFLRSMLPEDRSTKLQLPRTLQALLASNLYPPPDSTYLSSTLVSVPLVTIRTNIMSGSPVEMLNRVPKVLTFENSDMFEAKEDFALLKSLCRSDDNILNKLSMESRRIVEAMCQKPRDSALKAGWPEYTTPTKMRDPHTQVIISRVSLDDYFIWSWLASLSFEQTTTKKKLFGRALISEVVFDGFKKWIIVEEQNTYANVRNHQPPLPEKPKVKKVTQGNYTSMLDDLPDDKPARKSKPRKQKVLPVVLPQVSDRAPKQQRTDSSASKKLTGLLNPLKKLQQQHNTGPLPAPAPQYAPAARMSVYHPPEQVEPLPEIETNQYRLSIPLDSFGFDYSDPSVDQTQNSYSYDNQGQYNYQSLNPQQPQYNNSYTQNQQNEEEYNYWSSEPPRTLAPPQNNRNSSYEIGQVISSMDQQPPQQDYYNQEVMQPPSQNQYNEPRYRDSIENLSSMVDQMTVQVGQVENKLVQKPTPMWDVEVPLPQHYNEYENQRDTQQGSYDTQYNAHPQFTEPPSGPVQGEQVLQSQYPESAAPTQEQKQQKILPPMVEIQKRQRKSPTPELSTAGSSVYGPTPTALNTPAFRSEDKQDCPLPMNIPGTNYPSNSNEYSRVDQVPQIQIPHPKRKSQDVQQQQQIHSESLNQPMVEQPVQYTKSRSMVDDTENYSSQITPAMNDHVSKDQRYSYATTGHESYYSAETLQRGETPYTDASEIKSPNGPSPHRDESNAVNSKRSSNKYPESIIDSYQRSINSSPQKYSQKSSPEKDGNLNSMNAATAASMRATMSLSVADANYIPEPELYEVPAPAPVPRSPLAQKRLPPSPVKSANNEVSDLGPVPKLATNPNSSMDSLPTQDSYVTSRQTPENSVPQTLPEEPQTTQQRLQRKAPAVSPVRNAHLSGENFIPQQDENNLNQPQYAQEPAYDQDSDYREQPQLQHQQLQHQQPQQPQQQQYQKQPHPQQQYQQPQQQQYQQQLQHQHQQPQQQQQQQNQHQQLQHQHQQTQQQQPQQQQQHEQPPRQQYEQTAYAQQPVYAQDSVYTEQQPQQQPQQQHQQPQQQPRQQYAPQPQQYPPQQEHSHPVSPNRPPLGATGTPQRPHQQNGAQYGPAVSPVSQGQVGGPQASLTPNRSQNLAPPGSAPRRNSPTNNYDSRGGSPYRPQGGDYLAPHRDGHLNPNLRNGNGRPRGTSVSSVPVPQGANRQQSPMHGRSSFPDQQDRYKNHSPARPGSVPAQSRERSPQHAPPAQAAYPASQGQHPPQGYPPQGYPPQGYAQQSYPPQGYPPQNYPPQNYPPQSYPPQGYPPQGYPPQGYPPQGYPPQGYYPPPPQGYYPPAPGSTASKGGSKPSASDMALQSIPAGVGMNKLHHKPANKMDKKNMRNALTQGNFGI